LKRPAVRLAFLLTVVVAALGATTGAASAKESCGHQVIDDWYGSKTGQLSRTYPIHCYRDALRIVGSETDLEVYSNARQDILRAMQLAIAIGKNGGGGPFDPTQSVQTADALPSFLGGPDAKNGGHPPAAQEPQPTTAGKPDPGPVPSVLHSSSPSSVPVPAIVLGAVAALLLALGAAAYFARRRQQRRQSFRPRHANGQNPS